MRVFKSRWFDKWATGEGLNDETLLAAVAEMEDGLVDARLGGHVVKKRVALPGRGKRGGSRTLVAYRKADKTFFSTASQRRSVRISALMSLRCSSCWRPSC